ncbi:MAG: protein kinase [Planctomycetia bacterium]|nr:protein kinase [Planctomycetia bacterium]
MAMTVDQFGKAIIASGLLTTDEVKSIWSGIASEERPKDGESFAKLLITRGKLTALQAREIIAGRGSKLMLGDYTILSEIGAGGMGKVYKAQHRRMKRIVALKVMSNAAMKDEAAVRRFQREVEAAARLEHPNIVTAYDSGDAGDVKYLVMQFVDGGDLSDLVKTKGPLSVEKAVEYVSQTARGLAYAHSRGVIHRDIKPANLLLNKDGNVKVLDMGLARMEDGGGDLTGTEQVMGTVDYMSPEQASDTKNVDARADIYALGCTLWYLLTGKKVFDCDTMIGRLMKHRDAPPPSLVKERDDVPWPLEQAFHKMVAKRPQDRYQSMDEVLAALMPFTDDSESVLSHHGSGSGIGGSSVGRSAELASFMHAMESGIGISTAPGLPARPPSGSHIDATSQFAAPEAETDAERAALPRGIAAQVRKTGSSSKIESRQPSSVAAVKKPASGPPMKLIAGGIVGLVVLLAGIFLMMRGEPSDSAANTAANSAEAIGTAVAFVPPVVRPSSVQPVAVADPVDVPPSGEPTQAKLLESLDYAWTEPENLGPNVNTSRSEEFPSLSADELCLAYRLLGPGGPNAFLECRRSSITEPFGPAVRLPNSGGIEDPFLSADGLTLVYATPSGDRRTDLRMRTRLTRDAPWAQPETLDPRINTSFDERQPWISPNGLTLLYQSDRKDGLGARDLWLTRRASRGEPFGLPEAAPRGINTSADEFEPYLLVDGKTFLFNRSGRHHISFISGTGIPSALSLHDFPSGIREVWLSPDGRRMYFQSRRSGGFGDYDLWMSRRVKKSELAVSGTGLSSGQLPPLPTPTVGAVYLDDLTEQSWKGDRDLGKHGLGNSGGALKWHGSKPAHSLLTYPDLSQLRAEVIYRLDSRRYDKFLATVGMTTKPATALVFRVHGDGKILWQSPPLTEGDLGFDCNIEIRGVEQLRLEVVCSGPTNLANAVWIDPRLTPLPKAGK